MKEVRSYCEQWEMLPAQGLVLCAVSGGRDSMAMLHLMWTMGRERGFSVAAAHFNHQLRITADRDEDLVRAYCRDLGIPCYVGGGDVAAAAKETGRSLEDAARQARYDFLERTAETLGAARIATAHHRQDNAETILLNLLRGTGLQGLTGIPPVRGRIIRPLLDTDRKDIDRYIQENNIPYVEDETNADPAYARRNRLRLEVLPLLEDVAPGCTGRVTRMAEVLRGENDHLRREAAALLPPEDGGESVSIPTTLLQKQDEAVVRRLVRMAAGRLGRELTAAQTEAVLQMSSGTYLDLGSGVRAVRKPHRLTISREKTPHPVQELRMGQQKWGDYAVEVAERAALEGENAAVLALDAVTGPLAIGPWDGTGRLAVGNGSRTMKRLFADRRIPVERRGEHPALYLAGEVIAVLGVAVDRRFAPREGERTLTVSVRNIVKE